MNIKINENYQHVDANITTEIDNADGILYGETNDPAYHVTRIDSGYVYGFCWYRNKEIKHGFRIGVDNFKKNYYKADWMG